MGLNEQAEEKLSNEIGMMVHQYHFVYQILNLTSRICTPNYKTMGVCVTPSSKFELHYDPEFVLSLKSSWLRYVLYHEILHMVLGHCTHRKNHFENHEIGNIATDIAINQLIPDHRATINGQTVIFCERPEGEWRGLQIEDFKKKYPDILERQNAEYYYDFLMKKQESGKGESGEGESGNGFDCHEEWQESELAAEKIRNKIKEIETNYDYPTMELLKYIDNDKELLFRRLECLNKNGFWITKISVETED